MHMPIKGSAIAAVKLAGTCLLVVALGVCILSNHLQHGSMLLAERRHLLWCKALCQGQGLRPVFQVLTHLQGSQRPAAA